jgi:site-specific recombinase XerD
MRMHKLEPRTREAYIRAVRKLAAYLERSPDTASVEELRSFQLHLVDTGTSPITLNATLTGLKFFFDITLGRSELMAKMQPVKVPRTLAVVLSPEEVSRLIAAARNVKHQAALSAAYGAGLRMAHASWKPPKRLVVDDRSLELSSQGDELLRKFPHLRQRCHGLGVFERVPNADIDHC